MESYDVVVVGAGPTGFTLAIDLGRRGITTLLIEKDPSTKHYPKMDRSNARTMEMFRRLGIADRVRELGYSADSSMDVFITTRLVDEPILVLSYPTVAECRARTATSTDGSEPLEPYQLVSQNDLEPLLKEVAEATPGVTVRFGCELVDFVHDAERVTATLRTSDGTESEVVGSYLVGCDGGSSATRKKLGIALSGRANLLEQRQVSFRSPDLYDRIPIGKGRHYYLADEHGGALIVQGSQTMFTLNAALPPDADLEQAVRDRLGFDVDFEITGFTDWKLHLLLAERYRDGRVFLAGDAVHLVIPTGGLGMNSGVGDAIDLSWKLAATVQGWAGPSILDSYEVERRRVGARNVEAAGWAAEGMFRWRQLYEPAVWDDTPQGEQVRAAIATTADQYHRRVHEMVGVELGYSYAGSPVIMTEPDDPGTWDTRIYLPSTRPGVRVPHQWLSDGRALHDVLGLGFTILDLTAGADVEPLEKAMLSFGAPIEVLRLDEPAVRETFGCSLLLIRPDLHIVWRGDELPVDVSQLVGVATGHTASTVPTAVATAGAPS